MWVADFIIIWYISLKTYCFSTTLTIATIKNLPEKPGIYFYKDKDGEVIYIGKARSLKKRVGQYFQRMNYGNSQEMLAYGDKISRLVSNIVTIDIIVTENEKEALILENDMVKKYQPHYNIALKDDKSFPWIMITYSEEFPRIITIRQPKKIKNFDNKDAHKTKNRFFGPYISIKPMKDTLKVLRKYFPYCTCKKPCKINKRPCLNYQIKLCPGPCAGKISAVDYQKNIKSIERILDGDIDGIIEEINEKMLIASKDQDYENAALYRDTIQALNNMTEKQSMVSYDEAEKINRDIIGYHKTLKKIGILIMHVRDGRLIGKTPFIFNTDKLMGTDEEILLSFLERYYIDSNKSIPDDIILPNFLFNGKNKGTNFDRITKKSLKKSSKQSKQPKKTIKNQNSNNKVPTFKEMIKPLVSLLKDKYDKLISIKPKGTGPYTNSLLRIANKNVMLIIKLENEYDKMMTEADALHEIGMDNNEIAKMKKDHRAGLVGLIEVKEILGIDELPRIIEGFDISSLQQQDATGSMVCFIDGKPSKSNYRSYTIKNLDVQGDFAMMQEVVRRRYKGVLKSNGILPDLIVMDGGKAQVNAAKQVLEELEIGHLNVIGLEKKKTHTEIDRIVFQDHKDPKKLIEQRLKEYTPGYNLLNNISQEYHRRAIQHHRKRMARRVLRSELEDIKGIGEMTRNKLHDHFGTLEKIKEASLEDMQAILGSKKGETIFNNIKQFYNK